MLERLSTWGVRFYFFFRFCCPMGRGIADVITRDSAFVKWCMLCSKDYAWRCRGWSQQYLSLFIRPAIPGSLSLLSTTGRITMYNVKGVACSEKLTELNFSPALLSCLAVHSYLSSVEKTISLENTFLNVTLLNSKNMLLHNLLHCFLHSHLKVKWNTSHVMYMSSSLFSTCTNRKWDIGI